MDICVAVYFQRGACKQTCIVAEVIFCKECIERIASERNIQREGRTCKQFLYAVYCLVYIQVVARGFGYLRALYYIYCKAAIQGVAAELTVLVGKRYCAYLYVRGYKLGDERVCIDYCFNAACIDL